MRSVFNSKSVNSDAVGQRILMQLLIEVAEGHKNDRDISSFFRHRDWSKLEPADGRFSTQTCDHSLAVIEKLLELHSRHFSRLGEDAVGNIFARSEGPCAFASQLF